MTGMTTSELTVNSLPDDLAALLARHGVEATEGAVLDALSKEACWFSLNWASLFPPNWYVNWGDGRTSNSREGETRLTALARAFAALVESEDDV